MSDDRHAVTTSAPDAGGSPTAAVRTPTSRVNLLRDACAAGLLIVALILPWNVFFGVGVPGTMGWPFALVGLATVASLIALALSHGVSRKSASMGADSLRRVLNVPYLLLVLGFAMVAIVKAVGNGGDGNVAPGIGPGALVGLAGALLGAQPTLLGRASDAERLRGWFATTRIIGVAAMVLATFSVLLNLYWRTRFVLPNIGDATYGTQNVAVVATALVYGAVALIGVLVGLRWLLQDQPSARLATIALGASALLASVLVWAFGVGRDIDAFHGIGQTTSTAAVGFEGYLAWTAGAAIVAPFILVATLGAKPLDKDVWREAARKCLLLIAVWCAGSGLLRMFDLIVAISLDLPYSPYDSVALMAFDLIAAAVAVWVRVNITTDALHPVVISALSGVMFILAVCRVVVGVGLSPRILYTAAQNLDAEPFGNTLAHQITSTFDVVLCGLALAVLAVAILVLQLQEKRERAAVSPATAASTRPTAMPSISRHGGGALTTQLGAPMAQTEVIEQWAAPTETISHPAVATPRPSASAPKIARPRDDTQQLGDSSDGDATAKVPTGAPKIARLLEESTQRFGAGTTYTGSGRNQSPTDTDEG